MHDAWIPSAKLSEPAQPPGWLRRALPATAPVLVLAAGPGYGKTLALLALALAARDAGHLTAWFSADEGDVDQAAFFRHLVAAVKAQIPPFGEAVLGALDAGKLDARGLWARFFEELAGFNLPGFFLALDDVHLLVAAQPALVQGLVASLERLPPGMRLGLATRGRFPYALSKLQAKGLVAVLGPDELRFTAAEEAALLADRPAASRERVAAMEGWPLGVDLASGLLAHVELKEYVAEEVLATLPPARLAVLERAAWLDAPTAEALEAIFGLDDAGAHLAALEADLLVQRQGAVLRLPAYLRDHLRAKLEQETTRAQRQAWHLAATRLYADDPERALPHLLAAGEVAQAAQACQAIFPAKLARGQVGDVARWLAAFPAGAELEDPILAYWHGQAHGRAGRSAEAAAHYERALKGFRAREDAAGELRVLGRLATLAAYAGDRRRAGSLLTRALGLLDQGGAAEQADFHLTRAASAEQRGDFALMRECNEAVLALPAAGDIDVAACHVIAHQNLYTWAVHRGQLATAEDHARRLEATADAWAFYPARLLAGFLRTHLRLVEGDLDAAGVFLRERPPHWQDLLDWLDLGIALTIEGHYHQAKQEWKEADRAYERARATFAAAGHVDGEKVPLERQLWQAAERKQFARVEALYPREAPEVPNVFDHGLALARAWSLKQEGRTAEAQALLGPALEGLAELEAHLAYARGLLIQDPEAATRFIAEHGFDFLRQEPIARGVAAPSPPPAAGRLVVSLFGDFAASLDGARLDAWPRRKAKLLLAALALYPRGLAAVELAEMLAEGEVGQQALMVVQANASALRKVLGGAKAVTFVDGRYALEPSLGTQTDALTFDRDVAEGLRLRASSPSEAFAALQAAMAAYPANLLEEPFFEPYFHAERSRYQQQALTALGWLATFREGLGDFSGAEADLVRAARLAPADEDVHQRLMGFYASRKAQERVRHTYWDFRKALKARLGMEPSEGFEAAYRAALGAG